MTVPTPPTKPPAATPDRTADAVHPARGASVRRTGATQLLAASAGNAVEWFDWYVYSILAVYFSKQFFPPSTEGSLVPLLGAMAVFAVGFFARPIGGLVIGSLADRFGRKALLVATVLGMGVGSLMIAVSPTYTQIGVLAPIILVVARLIQGVSAGGEFAAGSAFMVESAPRGRRGLYSSFFYVSSTTANLFAIGLAVLLSTLLPDDSMATWGWRVPFLLGGLGALVALWVRTRAEETFVKADPESGSGAETSPGMFTFFRRYPKSVFLVFGITAGPALVFYIWTGFLPTYANFAVGFNVKDGLLASVISLSWFLVLQPVMGSVSDRVGRKPLAIASTLFFTVATVPLLAALNNSFLSFLVVQIVGLTFVAAWSSIGQAVFCELFPRKVRSAGIGFPYALSVALFGGTAPYIATWFGERGDVASFAWYIAGISLFSTVVVLLLPETAKKDLD